MTRKHSDVFDDVLSGLDAPAPTGRAAAEDRAGTRFLARSTRVAERLSGEVEEKALRWVDPAECRMWARHNRAYDLLTEENCRDLIEGIRAQGRQEFPAVVRRTGDAGQPFEVICGARRHFAVTWLRAHNYPQYKYLVDIRDLTDEEAFRLSDIENRDREDISDYERACDYADAVDRYYGGRQKDMAARLEVSEAWLSRYLQLARLPKEVIAAFRSIRDIRELHARTLKPHLGRSEDRASILAEAGAIRAEGATLDGPTVVARLVASAKPRKTAKTAEPKTYRRSGHESGIACRRGRGKVVLEFPEGLSRAAFDAAIELFRKDQFGK